LFDEDVRKLWGVKAAVRVFGIAKVYIPGTKLSVYAMAKRYGRLRNNGLALFHPPNNSRSERISTNPGHQWTPGANSKLADEMFFRIRLIKVSDQLRADAKARQTGQRSQRTVQTNL
jgi:hypothetical protein